MGMYNWLVVWTPLKNISQLGWLFPIYGKIKNVPNHQPDKNWGGTLKFHGLSSVPSNGGHLRLLNAIEPLTRYEIELTVQPSITLKNHEEPLPYGYYCQPWIKKPWFIRGLIPQRVIIWYLQYLPTKQPFGFTNPGLTLWVILNHSSVFRAAAAGYLTDSGRNASWCASRLWEMGGPLVIIHF